ncbi:MAG: hypothetical protein VW239_03450 [Candidatus Nanopelagicales bacterium]
MKLWLMRPDPTSGYPTIDDHEVADEAAADALIKKLPRGWREALLLDDVASGPRRKRFPRSRWADVRSWPGPNDLPSFEDDVRAVADWLRAAGVRLSWPQVLRAPWVGRQRGDVCAATCLEPDETLRSMRRKRYRALDAVVGLIMQDGMERGALHFRRAGCVDELRRWMMEATKDAADLRRQLHDARNDPQARR